MNSASNRMFSLSENEIELIERKSTVGPFQLLFETTQICSQPLLISSNGITLTGFLGCIFDLDTVMVDLQKVRPKNLSRMRK